MKLLRKCFQRLKRGKVYYFVLSRSTEHISKKKIHYMKLHQNVKASAWERKQLTQNKKQPSK